ncbi:CU044_5270 family protein [Amycolatopsis magusensis]|uniref:CU044_5270 family protein n=1 Tax=Amycolatopsis magusensis TaxID=882444 RepID=A0ABS4PP43_9PSEU|nr:CU044_5270 family protein [Amycolatopsis magusensis]MBP2180609.1 hypothetical protein [Amycolatopsis magusensis]
MADWNADRNVRQVWSEDDLDRALAALNAEVPAGESALAKARAELMGEAGVVPAPEPRPHRRRDGRWWRWAAAFGTVAAVVAGVLVLPALPFGDETGVPSAAAEVLNRSADRIGTADDPVPPGQYRYVEKRSWLMTFTERGSYLGERVTQLWVPAAWSEEWVQRDYGTAKRKWIEGGAADLPEPERLDGQGAMQEVRARCGDFFVAPADQCRVPGSWGQVTPEFLASLPSDPVQLYQRLRADTAGKSPHPDLDVLTQAADALGDGLLPAPVRANLFRALAMVPSLQISDRNITVDGRIGIGLGVDRDGFKEELVIDQETGQLIGVRTTDTRNGSVRNYTSVVTGAASGIGVVPVR